MPQWIGREFRLRKGDMIECGDSNHVVTACNDSVGDIQIGQTFVGLGIFYHAFRFDLEKECWIPKTEGTESFDRWSRPLAERVSAWKLVQTEPVAFSSHQGKEP